MITRKLFYSILFLLIPVIFTAGHKFYLSLTQIDINSKTHKLEIAARVFTHDLENTILAETGHKLLLGSVHEAQESDSMLTDYLHQTIRIIQGDKEIVLSFVGKEIETDVTWLYLESPAGIDLSEPLKIKNVILFERFPNQKNIVNVRFEKQISSQIHTRNHPEYEYKITSD